MKHSLCIFSEIGDKGVLASADHVIYRHPMAIAPVSSSDLPLYQQMSPNYSALRDTPTTKYNKNVCQICEKQFSSICDLRRHMVKHTGEKPYKCEYCHKGYSQRGDLKRHLVAHTGQGQFNCINCGRSFVRKDKFNFHISLCLSPNTNV